MMKLMAKLSGSGVVVVDSRREQWQLQRYVSFVLSIFAMAAAKVCQLCSKHLRSVGCGRTKVMSMKPYQD